MLHSAELPGRLPEGFLELPDQVYAEDPMWIPEDPATTQTSFSDANPWFRQGAARAWWLPGEARVAAFHDPKAHVYDQPAAFFGFWETTGGREANLSLFEEVEAWARSRGAKDLYGPINFTTHGLYRLRTSAEPGAVTFQGEPYNPPCYPSLLESLGFEHHQSYVTQLLTHENVPMMSELLQPIYERSISVGYRISALDASVWLDNLPELYGMVDATFGDNFAYTPLSYEAFVQACGPPFARKACPRTSVIAYGPEGDIAGIFLCFPHYGPLITAGAGPGRVKVVDLDYTIHMPLLQRFGTPEVLFKTVGVSPQHRQAGLMQAMSFAVLEKAVPLWNRAFGALIKEDNPSRRLGMKDSVPDCRCYALYRKPLESRG